jgi:hypothetical protein
VAVIEHTDIADLVLPARFEGFAIAIDGMTVQVEGDVVGTDHDAVVRAIREINVEIRIDRDRVAAA